MTSAALEPVFVAFEPTTDGFWAALEPPLAMGRIGAALELSGGWATVCAEPGASLEGPVFERPAFAELLVERADETGAGAGLGAIDGSKNETS